MTDASSDYPRRRDAVRTDREAVYEVGLRAPQLYAGVDGARRDGPHQSGRRRALGCQRWTAILGGLRGVALGSDFDREGLNERMPSSRNAEAFAVIEIVDPSRASLP